MKMAKMVQILIGVLFFLTFDCTFAGTYYVSPRGNDETGSLDDPSHPFLTFQAALDKTETGDTVSVEPGTYSVSPVLVPWYEALPEKMAPIQMVGKTDITIEGHPNEEERVTIAFKGPGDVFCMMNCTNIVCKGLDFLGNKPSVPDGEHAGALVPLLFSVIHLRGNNEEINISECSFDQFGNHAVSHLWSPKKSKNVTVSACHFSNGGATNVTNLSIDGSAVSGIGSYWNVNSNFIANCQRGLEIECFSPLLKHDISLHNNTLTNILDYGVMLFATCSTNPPQTNFKNITIASNVLQRAHYGILVTGGEGVKIVANKISFSDLVGIGAMSSFNTLTHLEISGNTVTDTVTRGIQATSAGYTFEKALIRNNQVRVTGNSGILVSGTDILVQSNSCQNCGWMGSFGGIEANGTDVRIVENVLTDSGAKSMKYGVIINTNAKNTSLFHNSISGYTLAPIKDNGLETDYHYLLQSLYKTDTSILIHAVGTTGSTQSLYASCDGVNWDEIAQGTSDKWGEYTFTYELPTPAPQSLFFKASQALKD